MSSGSSLGAERARISSGRASEAGRPDPVDQVGGFELAEGRFHLFRFVAGREAFVPEALTVVVAEVVEGCLEVGHRYRRAVFLDVFGERLPEVEVHLAHRGRLAAVHPAAHRLGHAADEKVVAQQLERLSVQRGIALALLGRGEQLVAQHLPLLGAEGTRRRSSARATGTLPGRPETRSHAPRAAPPSASRPRPSRSPDAPRGRSGATGPPPGSPGSRPEKAGCAAENEPRCAGQPAPAAARPATGWRAPEPSRRNARDSARGKARRPIPAGGRPTICRSGERRAAPVGYGRARCSTRGAPRRYCVRSSPLPNTLVFTARGRVNTILFTLCHRINTKVF